MHQRTEAEIMKNWKGDVNTPTVSICTITYNHEIFIEEALDSFLMQETSFPFEIVIDDDCSTDSNAKIIQRYIKKYPTIISAQLRSINVGMRINGFENLKRAKGKYIALCEGDDYWINKNKLQLQVDTLKKHTEIDICFHKTIKVTNLKEKNIIIGGYLNIDGIVPIEDIILKSKGQVPTASTVFKKKVLEHIEDFQSQRPWLTIGDIYIHFFGAKRGGAYFINKAMSVYRHSSEGSWTSIYQSDYKKRITHADARIKSYEELDTIEMNRFTPAFKEANKKRVLGTIMDQNIPYFNKASFAFKHRKYFSLNEKIAYYGIVFIPFSSYIPKDTSKFLKKLLNI